MENRRHFIKKGCLTAFGAVFLAKQATTSPDTAMDDDVEHTKWWLNTLLNKCESKDNSDCSKMIEACGRACAQKHIDYFLKFKDKIKKLPLNEAVKLMNENHIGGDSLELQGDTIVGEYAKCYCPSRKNGMIESPAFCNCTVGWLNEVYENLFDKKVEVSLLKSIGRGDKICQYSLKFKD